MQKQNKNILENASDAWELINRSSKITLLAHARPDGDTVGACAALELVLSRLGKQVETIYPDQPEFAYTRQPKKVLIGEHSQEPDLLIASDSASYERLYFPDVFKNVPLINIDHHVSNSIQGTYNFIDSQTSSACEVLYALLNFWDPASIDSSVAQLLLFGILYDSQIFRTQATTADTLRIAADLVDKGANLFQLRVELFANKDPKIIKLWGMILNRIEISEEKKAAWTYILQEDLKKLDLTLSSVAGFIDFLAGISKVDVIMFFYEREDGASKVSLRSKEYDVNKFAAKFGGGGHKHAAGILIEEPLLEVMKKMTVEL